VDQERIAEEEALRSRLPERLPEEGSIPLATDTGSDARPPGRPPVPAAKITHEVSFEDRKRTEHRKMLKVLIVSAIVVPVVSIATLWGYYAWSTRPTPPKASVESKAKNSEVLSSLDHAKVRRNAPTYASLLINTDPPGALVFLNQRLVADQTPVNLNNVPARAPIQIKISKFGYKESIQLLNLTPGEKKELSVKLEHKR
ncbi:MAG: PEGA domain-containing protein, partial [Pseudomonadota bacterium]